MFQRVIRSPLNVTVTFMNPNNDVCVDSCDKELKLRFPGDFYTYSKYILHAIISKFFSSNMLNNFVVKTQ